MTPLPVSESPGATAKGPLGVIGSPGVRCVWTPEGGALGEAVASGIGAATGADEAVEAPTPGFGTTETDAEIEVLARWDVLPEGEFEAGCAVGGPRGATGSRTVPESPARGCVRPRFRAVFAAFERG